MGAALGDWLANDSDFDTECCPWEVVGNGNDCSVLVSLLQRLDSCGFGFGVTHVQVVADGGREDGGFLGDIGDLLVKPMLIRLGNGNAKSTAGVVSCRNIQMISLSDLREHIGWLVPAQEKAVAEALLRI